MDFPKSRLLYPYNHDYRLYHDYDLHTLSKSQGDGGQKPRLTEPLDRSPSAYVFIVLIIAFTVRTAKYIHENP